MDQKKIDNYIKMGRDMLHLKIDMEDYQSDQQLKKPQPPLTKAPVSDTIIDLPRHFDALEFTTNDLTEILVKRKSNRVYTQQNISLLQLSYLLWGCQGVKGIRGKKYATLRTVPSGGARHPFETYMIVQYVDGLNQGMYHYLPMTHQIEYLGPVNDLFNTVDQTLVGQTWAAKASVVFYFSCVPYRNEWRYGIASHGPILIDLGHIGENVYLCSTALGLGTCGLGAFDGDMINDLFHLDGWDEFCVYAQPVGTIDASNTKDEDAFYSFVQEQDW